MTRRLGRIVARVALPVSLTLAIAGFASAVQAAQTPPSDEMTTLFRQILANPGDTQANLAYARLAERRGERRKALATYERVLLNEPGNVEARQGLDRIRRAIEPAWTNITLSAGVGYNSNPLQGADGAPRPGSAFGLIDARFRDERPLGWWRWRSEFAAGGWYYDRTSEMNTGYVLGNVGPLIPVPGSLALRPIAIAGYRWLDQTDLYGELGGGLELEGRFQGAVQALKLAAVYRDYGADWSSDSGPVVDLEGRFSFPALFFGSDALFLRPRVRWSDVGSDPVPFLPTQFQVGKYWEVGGRIDYRVALSDYVTAGAGFAVYQRWFADPSTVGGDDREDTYFAPGANVALTNLLSDSVDLQVDYIYQVQTSNDAAREFDAHLVMGRLVGRF